MYFELNQTQILTSRVVNTLRLRVGIISSGRDSGLLRARKGDALLDLVR